MGGGGKSLEDIKWSLEKALIEVQNAIADLESKIISSERELRNLERSAGERIREEHKEKWLRGFIGNYRKSIARYTKLGIKIGNALETSNAKGMGHLLEEVEHTESPRSLARSFQSLNVNSPEYSL